MSIPEWVLWVAQEEDEMSERTFMMQAKSRGTRIDALERAINQLLDVWDDKGFVGDAVENLRAVITRQAYQKKLPIGRERRAVEPSPHTTADELQSLE